MDSIRNVNIKANRGPVSASKAKTVETSKIAVDHVDLYAREFEEVNVKPNLLEKAATAGKKTAGLTLGALLDLSYSSTGAATWIHEQGHAQMVHLLFADPKTSIQIDAFDNIKNFAGSPTGENFGKILSGYDVNQDGAAGMTTMETGEKLSVPGAVAHVATLGRGVPALVAAAGCVAEEIPTFIGFAAGYKMRKQSPVMGYALMSLASIHHINTSLYPFSALVPSIASQPGHDWTMFAKATGIPPLLTAAAFASTLPVLGYVMHRSEKKREKILKNRWAVARLIQKKEISPKQLQKAFENYKGSDKIQKAQNSLAGLLDTPLTDLSPDSKTVSKDLRKAINALKKEYDAFSDYLAKEYPGMVEEELSKEPPPVKKTFKETVQDLKSDYAKAWKEDKVGTALQTGTIAGAAGIATGVAGTTAAALAGAGGIASALATAVVPAIPLVGTLGAANSIYKARKTVKNPNVSFLDKAASVSSAAFSTISALGLLGFGAPLVAVGLAGVLGTHALATAVKGLRK